MRRLSMLVISSLLALGLVAPAAKAGVRVEHRAQAVLVFPERGGRHPTIFVSALRMSGLLDTYGSVGSRNIGFTLQLASCAQPTDFKTCVVSRRHSLGGNFREGDVFEFDDDLGRAYLRVKRAGVVHELTWQASEQAVPTTATTDCGLVPAGTAAGMERKASVSGSALGRDLRGATAVSSSLTTVAFSC